MSGRVILPVVGVDPVKTREYADLLAWLLRSEHNVAVRASVSDFVTAEGSVDHAYLHGALLEPFRAGEHFALVGSRADGSVLFDPQWTSAPQNAFLVIDGPVDDPPLELAGTASGASGADLAISRRT